MYAQTNINREEKKPTEDPNQNEAQHNHEGSTYVEIFFSCISFCFFFRCCYFIIFRLFQNLFTDRQNHTHKWSFFCSISVARCFESAFKIFCFAFSEIIRCFRFNRSLSFHFISCFDIWCWYIYWHGFVAVVVCLWLVIIRTDKDTYRNVVNIYEFSQPFTSVEYPNEHFLIRIELALIWDEIKITTISMSIVAQFRATTSSTFKRTFKSFKWRTVFQAGEYLSFGIDNKHKNTNRFWGSWKISALAISGKERERETES